MGFTCNPTFSLAVELPPTTPAEVSRTEACHTCGHVRNVKYNVLDLIGATEVDVDDWAMQLRNIMDGNNETFAWDDEETDMRRVSKAFPDTLFTLTCQADNVTLTWKKYYKNGKCQVTTPVITFEPLDEGKMT